jgi:hypothetical protein
VTAAGVVAEADAVAQLRDGLSRALEANERLAALVEELTGEHTRLRERLAQRDAECEQMAAELAVLKRMVFGRSSEKGREPADKLPKCNATAVTAQQRSHRAHSGSYVVG